MTPGTGGRRRGYPHMSAKHGHFAEPHMAGGTVLPAAPVIRTKEGTLPRWRRALAVADGSGDVQLDDWCRSAERRFHCVDWTELDARTQAGSRSGASTFSQAPSLRIGPAARPTVPRRPCQYASTPSASSFSNGSQGSMRSRARPLGRRSATRIGDAPSRPMVAGQHAATLQCPNKGCSHALAA